MIPAPLASPAASPAALVDAIAAASAAPASPAARAALGTLGAPPEDFLTTLLSARIGLMAAGHGMRMVHHELRRRVPFPEELGPEIPVWDGQSVPLWREGVLDSPKYFSFFLDAPFPAYNPNYRRKWRPHEMLHGLVGFFWRPDMTRFEAYLGARLAELLPVAFWYGDDEIFRERCPEHRGQLLYRLSCPRCEQCAAAPYWEADLSDPVLREQSLRGAARAADYLETELAAIAQEIATGRRVRTHHPRLDGSSDAEGYLKGHAPRLTAWSFGATVEHFLIPGVDYSDTVTDLRDQMLAVRSALLSAELWPDPDAAARGRMRRVLRDIGYRTFVALEWLNEGSDAEATLMPVIEAAATLSARLHEGVSLPDEGVALVGEWSDRVAACADAFPPEVSAPLAGLAYDWWPDDRFIDAGLPQVLDGVRSALPNHTPDPAVVARFVRAPAFQRLGTLRQRYGAWCGDDRAWFNGWLHDLPHKDVDGELFAVLPEEGAPVPPAAVRLNRTLRRRAFPATLVAAMLDADAAAPPYLRDDGSVEVAAVWWEGSTRIVPVDPETGAAIDAIAAGEALDSDTLGSLLNAAIAVYLPPAR